MKTKLLFVVAVLFVSPLKADDASKIRNPQSDEPPIGVTKLLLDAKQTGGHLPKNMTLRVYCDMFSSDEPEQSLKEAWEFSSAGVHKLGQVTGVRTLQFRRQASRKFNSTGVCQDLIDAKIEHLINLELPDDSELFAGTEFCFGDRSIEILIDGKYATGLTECCAAAGYPKPKSLAFTKLYEKLASKARSTFKQETSAATSASTK